jgi:hypothetical protein
MPGKSPQPKLLFGHPHAPEWPQMKRVSSHDAAKHNLQCLIAHKNDEQCER